MGRLQNPKWEKAAQAMAEGSLPTEAFRKAGYSPNSAKQHSWAAMRKHPEIEERVGELIRLRNEKDREASRLALHELKIEKVYVLEAAVDTLEKALGRRKVKRTRAKVLERDKVIGQDENGNDIVAKVPHTVATLDFEAFAEDLPTARQMVEILGREHGLFVETKRVLTNPLDAIPADQLQDDLKKIREAIGRVEEAGKGQKPAPGSDDTDRHPAPTRH